MGKVQYIELFSAGLRGTLPGAILGFVLAGGVAIANHLLFEKELPISYSVHGKTVPFNSNTELNKLYKFTDDLRVLQAFQHHHARAYSKACACTAKICSLYDQYKKALNGKKDTTQLIAAFQITSMNCDLRWRQLFQSIADKSEAKEAEDAAMNLHLNFEEVLGKMRDELTATFNIVKPVKK